MTLTVERIGQGPASGGCEAPSRGGGRALPGLSAGRGVVPVRMQET